MLDHLEACDDIKRPIEPLEPVQIRLVEGQIRLLIRALGMSNGYWRIIDPDDGACDLSEEEGAVSLPRASVEHVAS
jgi:hypothetical protein